MKARGANPWSLGALLCVPLMPFAFICFYSAFHMLALRNVVKEWPSAECHRGESTWSLSMLGSMVSYEWTYGTCKQVPLKRPQRCLGGIHMLSRAPHLQTACMV